MNPARAVKRFFVNKIDDAIGANKEDIARAITDPAYLQSISKLADSVNPSIPRVNLSAAGLPYANIVGPRTYAEKNAMRDSIKRRLESLRNTTVSNPNIGEISISKSGINKAVNSSANDNKLIMLNNLPNILSNAQQVVPEAINRNVRYLYLNTPINVNELNRGALTTLKNGNFYNVNDSKLIIKRSRPISPAHKAGVGATSDISIADQAPKSKWDTVLRPLARAGGDVWANALRPTFTAPAAGTILRII